MSTTIGFGYSTDNNTDLYDDLKILADKFGYGLVNGPNFAEPDVKDGVEVAQKNKGWKYIHLLQSPKNNEASLAFGIHEELNTYETIRERPKFFNFLSELESFSSGKCKKLGVFFSGEWSSKDRVRYSCGNTSDLITLLSMPGNWGIRYLIPETGRLQDSDETPLIFDLKN